MKNYTIMTNNPSLQAVFPGKYPNLQCEIDYRELSFEALLMAVRDEVHKGAHILSHPLDGSVKPMETPYKSVLIEKTVGELDFDSLSLIENAIATCKKFQVQEREFLPEVQADFQMIDRSLMESALDAAKLV